MTSYLMPGVDSHWTGCKQAIMGFAIQLVGQRSTKEGHHADRVGSGLKGVGMATTDLTPPKTTSQL